MAETAKKIVITGGAGMIGQNLLTLLESRGHTNLTVIDRHPTNHTIVRQFHPSVRMVQADLTTPGPWQDELADCTHLVIAHAHLVGTDPQPFIATNIDSTRHLLEAAAHHGVQYIVHISTAAINSNVFDEYARTKKVQEELVDASGIPHVCLRPTLMFGWFDRKHLGWLSRFMQRVPVFPVPGSGRYLRQPLFAGDFCRIIAACLESSQRGEPITGTYKITGLERSTYIELIHGIKRVSGCRTLVLHIPYSAFWIMLRTNELLNKNPPFTTNQLKSLVATDDFEVIDWPAIFAVQPTPLEQALKQTFADPVYSKVVLDY